MAKELAPFNRVILRALKRYPPIMELYVKYSSVVNYIFVCGVIGVAVNYAVFHVLLRILLEPVAFCGGVAFGAASNYTFTVGRFGYVFGFTQSCKEAE